MILKLSHWTETSPLRYRKEVLYAGDWPNTGGDRTPIDELSLKYIAQTVNDMRASGIPLPFSKGTPHRDFGNPENKLGEIIGASVQPNEDGIPALYLDVAFANETDRDLALKNDVSVGISAEFVDGKDRVWVGALTHLASTATPLVPDLEPFMAIAASLTKSISMSKILEHLGVDSEDKALEAIKALQAKPVVEEKVELSYPPMMVEAMKDLRVKQLDLSVQSGEIGPVVRDKLAERFATDKTVALELSHNSDGGDFKNALELAKLASKNPPVATHGRSSQPGKGEVTLSHNGGQPNRLDHYIDEMVKDFEAKNGKK